MAKKHHDSVERLPRYRSIFPEFLALALLTILVTPSLAAQKQPEPAPLQTMSQASRSELEALVSKELQRAASGKFRQVEGARNEIIIHAKFDLPSGLLIVDMGSEYGPLSDSPAIEDIQQRLDEVARSSLENIIPYIGTSFRYGGKDYFYYHPQDWRPPQAQSTQNGNGQKPSSNPTVAVSAGHGYFKLYKGVAFDWVLQRGKTNDLQEDFITVDYANELRSWLAARSKVDAVFSRSTSSETHPLSDRPWWQVASKYHLEESYPENPEIWNSNPADTSNDREYKQDIRSRPLFANHLGVDAIVHLHTNASDNVNASGTRVYFFENSTSGQQLGDSILCSIKEIIHAQTPYEDFSVPAKATPGHHGENRLAAMPSIIVEVGFHTNANDAAALKDPVFRTASMKGVEKGYRLFAEGKTCEPLSIESANNSPQPDDKLSTVALDYKGHPEFPARLDIKVLSCPAGACSDGWITLAEPIPSPVSYDITCDVSAPREFQLRTTFTDADGVKAAIEHTATCLPASQGRSPSAAVEAKAHDGAFQMPQVSD